MNLLDSTTVWLLLSGSDEERFLDDMSFGFQCLMHRGFPAERILLFADQRSSLSVISSHQYIGGMEVHKTSEIVDKVSQKNPSKLVVIVTGHGSEFGIDASPAISPFAVIESLRDIRGLIYGLVVLGQCYAGVFNFLEVKKTDPVSKRIISPEICLIGAADLSYSNSIPVNLRTIKTVKDFACNMEWTANLFLLFFMWYVAEPMDVDGDKRNTVIDAYKWAGILSNRQLLLIKQNAFLVFSDATAKISQLATTPQSSSLASKAKQDLALACENILINQNPWILHANLARSLEL